MVVVVAIIMLLAAILTPVFKTARRSAQITSSIGNLKQQHLALKLYQQEWNGEGVYGEWHEMGYPPVFADWVRPLKVPIAVWDTPCQHHPDWGESLVDYELRLPMDVSITRAFEEQIVTFTDINCNDAGVRLGNSFEQRRGVGILLSGTIVNRFKTGDMWRFSWWSDPHSPVLER